MIIHVMIKAVSFCRHQRRVMFSLSYNAIGRSGTECSQPLEDLTREELIDKVKSLQKTCDSLKAKTSKYEAMSQKFQRFSFSRRKKSKIFDPETTVQRKIALRVTYFGWDYDGLQDNIGLDDSIEKILFLALRHTKLLVANEDDIQYSKCGRTDKGVSAFSQVFCLKLRSRIPQENGIRSENPSSECISKSSTPDAISSIQTASSNACIKDGTAHSNIDLDNTIGSSHDQTEFDYCHILNRVLPPDIRVIAWAYVDNPDFSARHKCVGRDYKYFFPRGSLDISAMNTAAKKFIGTHDFRNLCKINVGERLVYVRELKDFTIDKVAAPELDPSYQGQYQMCVATINGTGFLYHQVRYMMAVLFLIGMGLEEGSVIDDLLDVQKTPRRPQFGMCADYPLVLYDCRFEHLNWQLSKEAKVGLENDFQRTWLNIAIKTTLSRSMMEKFYSDVHLYETTSDKEWPKTFVNRDGVKTLVGHLLLENWSTKQYQKIITRHTAKSLEEHIESMENKRKRKLERMEADDS